MIKIGCHVSNSNPDMYLGSVKEALSYNANTFMIYTGAPQNTIRKNIEEFKIQEALTLMKENNINPNDLVCHAPYIINLANPDETKRAFAIDFLTKEIIRTAKLQITQIVLHPGSAVGLDRNQAIIWIAQGVNKVIENTKDLNVKIALETMAGKGNEVGKTFEELQQIISLINNQDRVSVCLDTCHIYDAGYDLVNNYDEVIKNFDQTIGLNKISVIHINDSKNPFLSHKDRHENFGFGTIGFETLLKIVYDSNFKNIPKILETPYHNDEAPYALEIKMIQSKTFDPSLKDKL